MWDYYLENRYMESIIGALQHLFKLLEIQYNIKPRIIESDNEIMARQIIEFLHDRGVKIEPSAPYTQAQNGGAERSGGVVKDKARAMRSGAKLPAFLWPEINRAAVYLYNRTPHYQANWKTPIDRFHTYIAHSEGIVTEDRKPFQAHLKAYGCKAFAMTTEALARTKKLQRFNPKAWIGYLVGYESTNIYRIWLPRGDKVIRTRDVIFNEKEFFSGNRSEWLEQSKDDFIHVSLEEFNKMVSDIELRETPARRTFTEASTQSVEQTFVGHFDTVDYLTEAAQSALELAEVPVQPEGIEKDNQPHLITPPETPPSIQPAALFVHALGGEEPPGKGFHSGSPVPSDIRGWSSAFLSGMGTQPAGQLNGRIITKNELERLRRKPARLKDIGPEGVPRGTKIVTKEEVEEMMKHPEELKKLHLRNLPPAPEYRSSLRNHPFEKLFKKAEVDHLQSHADMKTWEEVPKATHIRPLDCKWVYVYKFDEKGYL